MHQSNEMPANEMPASSHTGGNARTMWRGVACAGAALALLLGPDLASAFNCAPAPLDGCRQTTRARKSKLNLRSGVRPDKQKLVWKWFRGENTPVAAYGNPLTTEHYGVCMYDDANALVFQTIAPAGATCRSGPCWKQLGNRGFAFRDGRARYDGLTKIRLYRGTEGHAHIIVKGAGKNLDLAALPLGLPMTVQLQGSQSECWQSAFTANGVRRNNETRFRGHASLPQ